MIPVDFWGGSTKKYRFFVKKNNEEISLIFTMISVLNFGEFWWEMIILISWGNLSKHHLAPPDTSDNW